MKQLGPRRVIRRSAVRRPFVLMAAVSAVVLIHDLLAGLGPQSWRQGVFEHEWFGRASAAGFLFTAIGALFALRQFAMSHAPYLYFTRGKATESTKALRLDPTDQLWAVVIGNRGTGPAIIESIRYDVDVLNADITLTDVTFEEMLRAVESTGFRDEQDFVVVDWQPGMPIGNGEDRRLWELPLRVARQFRRLDAHVTYRSMLGDVFGLDVSAVPPRGLPQVLHSGSSPAPPAPSRTSAD